MVRIVERLRDWNFRRTNPHAIVSRYTMEYIDHVMGEELPGKGKRGCVLFFWNRPQKREPLPHDVKEYLDQEL